SGQISKTCLSHTCVLSFNECLVSLMTSKCDSLVLGLKRKVLCLRLPESHCEQSGH
uniref:Uncharacterized protein n=1 Tax=Lates calcarifer TaxID=8187 RepID=A0A4W6E411_LATCA